FNLTIPLQQLNGLETLVIIMVANKYAFLQITRRRFLNEWEAFMKVISRRNIRRRITIPLTLSRSEERFSRNAETDLVCRLLLEKKKRQIGSIRVEAGLLKSVAKNVEQGRWGAYAQAYAPHKASDHSC